METSRQLALIDDFEDALAEHDSDRALTALSALADLDPADPAWPKRRAEIYRQQGQEENELNALLLTASLQVEAGLVARAMASCKRILVLAPDHPETEQMLSLLYVMPSPISSDRSEAEEPPRPLIDLSKVAPASPLAPIQEIVLTDAVAETRSVALADLEQSPGAAEISLGADRTEELDLLLEDVVEDELGEELLARPHAAPDETQSQLLMGSLFRAIGTEGVRTLVANGEILDFPSNVPVINQGDRSDHLYVVIEGAVVPVSEESNGLRGGIRMGVIESGDFFGEIGLLTDQPRNATVRTLVETRLLAIDRKAVWHLLSNHEEALPLLLRTLRARLVDRLVRTHPLFNLFGRAKRGALAKQFNLLEVRDGSTVIQQGLAEQGFFVVLAGQLEVIESGVNGDKSLGMVEYGDLLGEFSELFDQTAQATVIARGKCWILTLSHRRFKAITKANPRLNDLLRSLAQKRNLQRRETYTAVDSVSTKD
jgi:CRP-like cAMP-binding protein